MILNYMVRVERKQPPPGWEVSDLNPNNFVVEGTYVPVLPPVVATKVAILDLTIEVPSGYVPQVGWRIGWNTYWVEVDNAAALQGGDT